MPKYREREELKVFPFSNSLITYNFVEEKYVHSTTCLQET